MKAILVIDFGEDDIENIEPISLSYRIKSKDLDMGYYLATKDIKLKPMPQEKELNKERSGKMFNVYESQIKYSFDKGYNACINKILEY